MISNTRRISCQCLGRIFVRRSRREDFDGAYQKRVFYLCFRRNSFLCRRSPISTLTWIMFRSRLGQYLEAQSAWPCSTWTPSLVLLCSELPRMPGHPRTGQPGHPWCPVWQRHVKKVGYIDNYWSHSRPGQRELLYATRESGTRSWVDSDPYRQEGGRTS